MSEDVVQMLPVFIIAGIAAMMLVVLILGSLFRINGLRYRMMAKVTMPRSVIKVASLSRVTAPLVEGAEERKNAKVRELEPSRISYDEEAADVDEDEDGDPDDGDLHS